MTTKKCCNICSDDVYIHNIKKCPYCDEEVCIKCIKKYTIETKSTEKKCMYCFHVLPRAVLIELLGYTYIENKIYKDHIKELLFQEEKTLIPQSLPYIEVRKKIKEVREYIKELRANLEKKIANGEIQIDTMEEFKVQGIIYTNTLYLSSLKSDKKKDTKKYTYKFPCGNNDCNGFVNSNWECDLCNKTTCKHCFIIKESEEHICKQEDIDTTELIKKDSKPCPKCNISIIKSDGCDQMWCVNCHTTFDWRTLKIKTGGVLHNPEYFRYMRDNGITIQRNPNDNPCMNIFNEAYNKLSNINTKRKQIENKLIKYRTFNSNETYKNYINMYKAQYQDNREGLEDAAKSFVLLQKKYYCPTRNCINFIKTIESKTITFLYEFYREINHISDFYLRPEEKRRELYTWKNEERIRFLEKEITETNYKINLAKSWKKEELSNEIDSYQITVLEMCKDTFINICFDMETEIKENILNNKKFSINERIIKLREFTSEILKSLDNIKKIYNLKKGKIMIPKSLYNNELIQEDDNSGEVVIEERER